MKTLQIKNSTKIGKRCTSVLTLPDGTECRCEHLAKHTGRHSNNLTSGGHHIWDDLAAAASAAWRLP